MVWRIEADTARNLLAVETRNTETGKPLFSAFDSRTGVSFIHEKPYGDRNWALAGTADRKLVIRSYGQNSPEGAGIACIDANNGHVLWEQFHYVLVGMAGTRLAVRHRNLAGGYEQHLDLATGDLVKTGTTAGHPEEAPQVVIPLRYAYGIPDSLANYPAHGDIFYCEIGSRQVWAFHEAIQDMYRVRIVISSGLTIVADRVVLPDLVKMLPELFFVIGNQLFIVSDNKQEIVSYLV